jgi:hypothetical protein
MTSLEDWQQSFQAHHRWEADFSDLKWTKRYVQYITVGLLARAKLYSSSTNPKSLDYY